MTETKQEPAPLTPSQAIQKGYTHFFMEEGGCFEALKDVQKWIKDDMKSKAEYNGVATEDYAPARGLYVAEKSPHCPAIDADDIIEHLAEQLYDRSLAEDPDGHGIDAVMAGFKERAEALANDINKAIEEANIDAVYLEVCPLDVTREIAHARYALGNRKAAKANV